MTLCNTLPRDQPNLESASAAVHTTLDGHRIVYGDELCLPPPKPWTIYVTLLSRAVPCMFYIYSYRLR
jgi:hypothetical protein